VKASQRRLAILASAAPVFNRKGFSGTSIADILDATDLEKGGLYNHFASKEELAVAAFEFAMGTVTAHFTRALKGTESGLPRLLIYLTAFERYIGKPPVAGGCPIANVTIEADDALPFFQDAVQKAFEEMRHLVLHNVDRGIAKGQFRSDTDRDEVADFMVAALEGAIVMSRGMRSRIHAKRVIATLRTWLLGFALCKN
jgi:TetR/AcrR family transcriptional repressor of nem operon